ncbi:MAG TPA: hypothetical protein VGM39_20580 [Kofleriaceae bacterium]
MRNLVIATILASATAYAGPFKETLSKEEIAQITKAVQAALPPIDATARTKCQPLLDEYNKAPEAKTELVMEAAKCLRSAGALGAAVIAFKTAYKYPAKGQAPEALRLAADGEEAAAFYDSAASDYEGYYAQYGVTPGITDATTLMIRATCIRRQLGDEEKANKDLGSLNLTPKLNKAKPKYDGNTLCDTIRPIAMPAKKS